MLALPAWQASASAPARNALASALSEHRGVLLEHLDDEEADLHRWPGGISPARNGMPWAGASWPVRPGVSLLIFLGAVLEDADASERASMLAAMPHRPG